jgi:sortase A
MAKSSARSTLKPPERKRLQTRVGVALITAGLLLGMTVVYNEFVEPYFSAQGQLEAAASIQEEFADSARNPATVVTKDELKIGESFAVLYAPRLGADYRRPIAQGTSVAQVLNTVGIGHYLHSAMPHEPGNFALAAHRTTHGGAFNNIDQFVVGDKLYVETRWGWYSYEVVDSTVVEPNEFWVVGENPLASAREVDGAGDVNEVDASTEPTRWLTLTTCTPRYTAEKRLVVWANLVDERARELGAPSEIADLVATSR